MHHTQRSILRAALCAGALVFSLAAQARQPASSDSNVPAATARKQAAEVANGAPARWHTEDVTVQARLRSIRKEAAAGLQENLGNCRPLPAADRSACQREARANYADEMANARARATSGE